MSLFFRSDEKALREYEQELLNKINKEHFSLKKLVHIYELRYICQSAHNA